MEDGKNQARGMQGPQSPVGIDVSIAVASTVQINARKVQLIAHRDPVGRVVRQGISEKTAQIKQRHDQSRQ